MRYSDFLRDGQQDDNSGQRYCTAIFGSDFYYPFMWLFFHNRPGKLDLIACAIVMGGIVLFFVDGLGGGGWMAT